MYAFDTIHLELIPMQMSGVNAHFHHPMYSQVHAMDMYPLVMK